jgi:CubicO group peptidase (beta-lactamase class C family)
VYDIATNIHRLRNSNTTGGVNNQFSFGPQGYPVYGDWDGDGRDTVGVFDPIGYTFVLRDLNSAGLPDMEFPYGSDLQFWWPMAGNWDRRGRPDEHKGYKWPKDTPASQNMNAALLDEASSILAGTPRVHSLLVVRNGKLVHESYFKGWNATMGNCIKSVSKSFLSALYGIAWEQGLVPSTLDTVESYVPEYFVGQDPQKSTITIAEMMTMTAGLDWSETGGVGAFVTSPDWVQWVIDQPLVTTPGAVFNYSTGLTHLGSAMLERAVGVETRAFAEEHLFEPLGIDVTRWDYDPQGFEFGGAEMWFRPRDMARFGQVFLDGGVADGVQVIHPDWVASTTTPIVATGGSQSYGAWWWQDTFGGEDADFAWGWGGQFIFIFEDLNMVVVTTSDWWGTTAESSATYTALFNIVASHVVPAAN